MARVRAKEKFFDNTVLRQQGEEFEYDGAPGKAIEFLKEEDRKAAERKYAEDKAKSLRSSIETQVRAELELKLRAEAEQKLRAEIEVEMRKQIEAELKGKPAPKKEGKYKGDSADLV